MTAESGLVFVAGRYLDLLRERDTLAAEVERLRAPEHQTEVAIKLAMANAYTLDEIARMLGLYAELARLRGASS